MTALSRREGTSVTYSCACRSLGRFCRDLFDRAQSLTSGGCEGWRCAPESLPAVLFNPHTAPGEGSFFLDPFEPVARSLAVEPIAARANGSWRAIRFTYPAALRTACGVLVRPSRIRHM